MAVMSSCRQRTAPAVSSVDLSAIYLRNSRQPVAQCYADDATVMAGNPNQLRGRFLASALTAVSIALGVG